MDDVSKIVAKNILILRTNNKFTQQELANKLNVTKATIANYESGLRSPSFEILGKLSSIFSVSIEKFFETDIQNVEQKFTENKKIPLLKCSLELIKSNNFNDVLDYIELPSKISSKCDYATFMTNNSMNPKILDNDIIFVKKTNTIENNEIGIFELNGQVIVKQFNLNIFTGEISLISICKDFPKINIKDSDYFNVLGKIICKLDYNF
jgi:repressor LexA